MTGIAFPALRLPVTGVSKVLNSPLHNRFLTVVTLLIFVIFTNLQAQVKPTAAADRLKAGAQKKYLEQVSLLKDQPFRNIGPSIMSGRVVDIDANPADATEFYVAYATGGLWHTTNNGQSFNPVFDTEDVLFIGDIAVNWNSSKDSSQRVIWVGTGEVNSSRSSYAGIGIYKTMNGGKNWEYKGLPESHHIGKIQLHPADKNTAWVAVLGHLYSANKERGVYKTSDGGNMWKQTLFIDDKTGVVDLDADPLNPDILYAAAWYRTRSAWNFEEAGSSGGIFKSVDGGTSWKKITEPGAGFPSGPGLGRIGIAVAPSNPQVVYAVLDNNFHQPDTGQKKTDSTRYNPEDLKSLTKEQFEQLNSRHLDTFLRKNSFPKKYLATSVKQKVRIGELKPTVLYDYLHGDNEEAFSTPVIGCELYRSDNGGQSWKKTHEKPIRIFSFYGYYFGKVFVAPGNENKVILTGLSIQLSKDGGSTFNNIDKRNVHSDHHVIWIDPQRENHLINGNDGGLNITYDDGANWFLANTPPVGQFYNITTDNASPYNVYGGLQDNGTWVGPSSYKASAEWLSEGAYPYKRLGGGDGMQVQVDTRDNQTVYSGFQFGYYGRTNRNGENYEGIRPQHDLGEKAYRFNWQTPIHLSIHNQDILYVGSNRFHRSMNRGDSLLTLSEDLTSGPKKGDVPFGTLTTIHESPIQFGLIYTGSDDGNIFVSRDGGMNWTKISSSLPPNLYVSRVQASAFRVGRVYASLNGYRNDHFLPYLFVSEDYGKNWRLIASDLPFEPINVIREDPQSDSILYVGTDGGLYVSLDRGTHYMSWNAGLPRAVPIHDIAIQKRENELILGTHGRSLFVAKLDSVQLLLRNVDYRAKKQAEVNRLLEVAGGKIPKDLFKREGIEIECPPVKRK